jgi:hypothetical protein
LFPELQHPARVPAGLPRLLHRRVRFRRAMRYPPSVRRSASSFGAGPWDRRSRWPQTWPDGRATCSRATESSRCSAPRRRHS